MKITKKQAIGENLLYMMVWLAIILVPVLNSKMMSELHVSLENVLTTWRKIAPYLTIFLVHNTVIARRYLLRHKYWRYLFCDLALIISVFWLVDLYEQHYVVETDVLYGSNDDVIRHKASFTDLEMYWNIILGLFMTGANSGIKLMYQSIRDEQKMEELKQQNMQAQMDYLKYQINPHFFMNTLNNIHALIDIDTEWAKNAVIELSKMMRYVLYDSERETISLNRDIQFLKNYIELMRIRYTDAVDIRIEQPATLPARITIPPLLLIVFVENAFKHGVGASKSSFIHIRIDCNDDKVTAVIANSRFKTPHTKHTDGIGLKNVRKRMELIYGPKNYGLQIEETANTYTVKLEIPTLHA
ncbi:MAG: histidine kinase [Alistipes sp.]|nr:histidine kinase [Alistipes sp.]